MARVTGLLARIVVASLAGLGSAILGIDALVHAASIHHTLNPNPDSPALEGVLGEALLAVTAVCAWLVVRMTRRLRHPAATTADSAVGPDAISRTPPSRHKFLNFVLLPVVGAIITAAFVFMSTAAIVNHSYDDRSAYVQAHGLSRSAVVDRVRNTATTDKGGTRYTATLNVTVKPPSGSDRNAVVYDPERAQVKPGSTVTVLLDPQQPAYGELPGHPDNQGWILPVILSIVAFWLGVMAVYFWLAFIARIRRQPIWSLVPGWVARAYLMRKKSGLERWPASR
jgi:hypothetical protein